MHRILRPVSTTLFRCLDLSIEQTGEGSTVSLTRRSHRFLLNGTNWLKFRGLWVSVKREGVSSGLFSRNLETTGARCGVITVTIVLERPQRVGYSSSYEGHIGSSGESVTTLHGAIGDEGP